MGVTLSETVLGYSGFLFSYISFFAFLTEFPVIDNWKSLLFRLENKTVIEAMSGCFPCGFMTEANVSKVF